MQVGFFQALVCPLYNMLAAIAPECHELLDGVNGNLDFWKSHPEAPPPGLLASKASSEESLAEETPPAESFSHAPPQLGGDAPAAAFLSGRLTPHGSSKPRTRAPPSRHRLSQESGIGDVVLYV